MKKCKACGGSDFDPRNDGDICDPCWRKRLRETDWLRVDRDGVERPHNTRPSKEQP